MKKRILSMLLVLCMVFTMMPSTVFATEGGTPIGISSVTDSGEPAVCEHTHDDTCGYAAATEGTPCSHLKEDGVYSCATILEDSVSDNTATPSDADKAYVCDHSDGCSYTEATEGADCIHECELCKPPKQEESITAICSCDTLTALFAVRKMQM